MKERTRETASDRVRRTIGVGAMANHLVRERWRRACEGAVVAHQVMTALSVRVDQAADAEAVGRPVPVNKKAAVQPPEQNKDDREAIIDRANIRRRA
jgi:hypothetical protein